MPPNIRRMKLRIAELEAENAELRDKLSKKKGPAKKDSKKSK